MGVRGVYGRVQLGGFGILRSFCSSWCGGSARNACSGWRKASLTRQNDRRTGTCGVQVCLRCPFCGTRRSSRQQHHRQHPSVLERRGEFESSPVHPSCPVWPRRWKFIACVLFCACACLCPMNAASIAVACGVLHMKSTSLRRQLGVLAECNRK